MKLNSSIRIIFLSVVLVIADISPVAANVTDGKAHFLPQTFIRPDLESSFGRISEVDLTRTWHVYTDRLPTVEQFYVKRISGPYVQLAKDEQLSPEGYFSDHTVEYGWIHHENLLLSEHCLVNNRFQPIKAIISNPAYSGNGGKDKEPQHETSIIYAHNDRELSSLSTRSVSDDEIYFVYKITTEAVLIGVSERFQKGTQSRALIGWLPIDNVLLWDNMLALEANWDKQALLERVIFNTAPLLFNDPVSAWLFSEGHEVAAEYIFWNGGESDQRNPGNMIRFPVIGQNNNIIKVGVWGSQKGYNADMISSFDGQEDNEKSINQASKKSSRFIKPPVVPPENFLHANERTSKDQKEHGQLAGPGRTAYTSTKVVGLRHPVFRYVYLLPRLELALLINGYQMLLHDPSREGVQKALIQLAKQENPDLLAEDIMMLPISELLLSVFTVPVRESFFSQAVLRNLSDPEIITDQLFMHFMNTIERKTENLQSILNTHYPYSFRSHHFVYYWIDSEDVL